MVAWRLWLKPLAKYQRMNSQSSTVHAWMSQGPREISRGCWRRRLSFRASCVSSTAAMIRRLDCRLEGEDGTEKKRDVAQQRDAESSRRRKLFNLGGHDHEGAKGRSVADMRLTRENAEDGGGGRDCWGQKETVRIAWAGDLYEVTWNPLVRASGSRCLLLGRTGEPVPLRCSVVLPP